MEGRAGRRDQYGDKAAPVLTFIVHAEFQYLQCNINAT
jgi:hypothetical protein